MKIIAVKQNGDFLIQADEDEIYNLIGFQYKSEVTTPKEGDTINVAAMFAKVHRPVGYKKAMQEMAKELRALAKSCESVKTVN